MDTTAETTTPAEYVQLRDQLALQLGAFGSDQNKCRLQAEHLLSSGLVPLGTIRARLAEVNAVLEAETASQAELATAPAAPVLQQIKTGAEQEAADVPVGAVYEDNDRPGQTWLYRKTAEGWQRTGKDHAGGFRYASSTLRGHGPMYPLTFVRMDNLS
jgi:tryptophan 2,3-dioxygenase